MTMDNCCTCGGLVETGEAFMLNATSDSGNPPASPTSNLTSLFAKAWTDLSALTYQDVSITGGSNTGTTLFRGMQKDDAGSYGEITDFSTTGFAERTPGELPIARDVTPNGASDPIWPVQPRPGGLLYQGQRYHGGIMQSSFWIWRPDIVVLGPPTNARIGQGKVDLETWRSRAKFNQASANSFLATAEIWTEKADHSVGWDHAVGSSPGDTNCSFFRYVNATFVSSFSLSADTWYEVPEVSDDTSAGTFAAGFVGRINFAAFFESRSSWETRTGITLL
jgi:hypothetical protein